MTDPFTTVEPIWAECFRLAWESFRAGSIPVGAVLVDAAGAVVRRGRNHLNEAAGAPIVGGNLAHAEVNALVTLPPGDYTDHVLYSTLEPCLLCTGALRHCHVGTVRFAAADHMWPGMDRIRDLGPHFARRWPRREGPLDGPLARLATVLHLVSAVERGIGSVVDCYAHATPDALAAARRIAGPTAGRLRSLSLREALPALTG
jgi:tRNA(adenine34) deaminase